MPRTNQTAPARQRSATSPRAILWAVLVALFWLLAGALLILVLYQVPAVHEVDIGGYDAAYVQGFHDAQAITDTGGGRYYLDGSNGSARWSQQQSFLLFPQAGLPAEVSLRLRGWRADDNTPSPVVRILLNNREVLAEVRTSDEWQQVAVPVTGGLHKATDVVIAIRSPTATIPGEGRDVGVLLDRATYRVVSNSEGFILPYPTQVAYGALVALLLWLNIRPAVGGGLRAALATVAALLLVGAAFLWLYRLQPPLYPYPLRWLLPILIGLLAAVLLLRVAPVVLARRRAWLDAAALAGIAGWSGLLLWTAQRHVTLSVPGVEKDFRVFATRTDSLDAVLRADGFYNLGYPLLLWLVRPLAADNAFLAGRVVAVGSGALLLLASYWLARLLLAELPAYRAVGALLTVLLLAFSPLVVQYALYVGSDMPFAALVALAGALLVAGTRQQWAGHGLRAALLVLLAGAAVGGAFLVRHLGLVLLVWGVLHWLLLAFWRRGWRAWGAASGLVLLFMAGFALAAAPQFIINTQQTGQPLYNQQAKNVWLAVYADTDWGRWNEEADTVALLELVRRDPARFAANWWGNVVAFLGSGAETGSAEGRALQLRLLGWPANWLAIAGLLGWLVAGWQHWRLRRRNAKPLPPACRVPGPGIIGLSLLLLLLLYVAGASLAFILPRFFLPLAPVYAVAAAWCAGVLTGARSEPAPTVLEAERRLRRHLLALLLLLLLLAGGVQTGARLVLERQPPDEVAAIIMTQAALEPGDFVLTRLPADVPVAKYSALAHRALNWPDAPAGQQPRAVLERASEEGVSYLLWDTRSYGEPPLPAADDALVGQAGRYGLYRLAAR